MRVRVMSGASVLLLAGTIAWAGAAKKAPVNPAVKALPAVKVVVNGAPSSVSAMLVGTTPLLASGATAALIDAAVKVEASGNQRAFQRPQAIVRIAAGAKEMYVDGQAVRLATPVVLRAGTVYVPGPVMQALFPDYHLVLAYDARTRTAFLNFRRVEVRVDSGPAPPRQVPLITASTAIPVARPNPAPTMAAASAVCAPTGGAQGVATQEFGKAGAKIEIVGCLPITHGCHVRTEQEVKKAYQAHPNDIHLVIYDLFGPEGQKYVREHGGQRAVVFVNGKSSFQYNGRLVTLEKPEGGTYQPSDIVPIVEQELAALKGS